jgi:hypothetical protein
MNMSIAKRIAANRANKERGFVDVEEWGEEGKPLRLFFTQVSARDIEKVQRKHKDFLSNTTMSAMVDMMIEKCEDEAGERAFTLEDKPVLMGEGVGVIAKVFGAVFAAGSVEDHEKN